MSVGSIEMQFYNLLIEKLEFTEQEKENFPGFHLDPSQWPRMKEVFKKKFLTKTQAEWTAVSLQFLFDFVCLLNFPSQRYLETVMHVAILC